VNRILAFIFLLIPTFLSGNLKDSLLEGLAEKGLTIDLKNPKIAGGVLSCSDGGVIGCPGMRVQAQSIRLTQDFLTAEGELIVSLGPYIFVGERIDYDLVEKRGKIIRGKSAIEPWYFGGEEIYIYNDECLLIQDGFITTSECDPPDWSIKTRITKITKNHLLRAKGVSFHLFNTPIFWLPSLSINLDNIFDSPIRYRVRYGGKQGLRFGMIYEVLDWNDFQALLRFDYRLERGPGGGLETHYINPHKPNWFHSINYVANDNSIDDPGLQTRYRIEGNFHNEWGQGTTSIDCSYDYLSDRDMATDYEDDGLLIAAPQRTQLNLRHQENEFAVTNFFTRVRVNNFQTIKQELPSISTFLHPLYFSSLGIISNNQINFGYLDFKYDESEVLVPGFHAWRSQFFHSLVRPFRMGYFTITPSAELSAILYSKNPGSIDKWMTIGGVGAEAHTSIHRHYPGLKHVIEPYVDYQVFMNPTINPSLHYIFDITDGWYETNALRAGTRNLLFMKPSDCCVTPLLTADLYTYLFFDTTKIFSTVPRLYLDLDYLQTLTLKHILGFAWDFERNQIGYVNYRIERTVSEDVAFSLEYRQRNAFTWRKSRYDNFMLDYFHSETELRNSLVSDKRNTLLANVFYRLDPGLATQFQIRHGWNRFFENNYTEYEADLLMTLRSSWQLRVSYQNKEDEHRITFYINLVGQNPGF